jgi:hypothetical protein
MGVKRLPAAHVNTEIKAVCTCLFDEGAQRSGVGGTVDHLEELLVFETVHHAEEFLARARLRKGIRAIFPSMCTIHAPLFVRDAKTSKMLSAAVLCASRPECQERAGLEKRSILGAARRDCNCRRTMRQKA